METSARAELPQLSLGIMAGGLTLYLANLVMQPAPVSALGAYVAGAIIMLLSLLRPMKANRVALGALAGALPAFWVHRRWHLSGNSSESPHSLTAHVLGEGLLGLAVALACLGIAGLCWRWVGTAARNRP